MKKNHLLFAGVFVLFFASFFTPPSAFATGELCAGTAANCCVAPQPILDGGGCPSGQVWIGDALTGRCSVPTSCFSGRFLCYDNSCYTPVVDACTTSDVDTGANMPCCAVGQLVSRTASGWQCTAPPLPTGAIDGTNDANEIATNQTISTYVNSRGFITDDTSVPKNNLVNSGTLPFDWLYTELAQLAGTSVLGRSANSMGDMAAISSTTDGQVLRRSASTLSFGAVDLADADAVTGVLPVANQAPETPQNLFETISTTSGTSPVADNATDTLTLTAGTGITVTGNSGTDAITIASTIVDTNSSTLCGGTNVYLDGDGNCDTVVSSPWVVSGSNIYYSTGNVGIGTASPTYPLHVTTSTLDRAVNVTNTNSAGGNKYGIVTTADSSPNGTGLYASGYAVGVSGNSTTNANGFGVSGYGRNVGTYGYSYDNIGVYGQGPTAGVQGIDGSVVGYLGYGTYGVYGSGGATGVYGSGTNAGVWGVDGSSYGVLGNNANGVYGYGTGIGVFAQGGSAGVVGQASGATAPGVQGENGSVIGQLGRSNYGVLGTGGPYGVYGSGSTAGVYGVDGSVTGILGYGSYGVYGSGGSYGAYGSGTTAGVYGVNGSSYGQLGADSGTTGVYGNGTVYGVRGSGSSYGLHGLGGSFGVYGGGTSYGVYGAGGTYGLYGSGSTYGAYGSGTSGGVYGYDSNNGTYGIVGYGSYGLYGGGGTYGVYGSGSTYGVYSSGNLYVNGTAYKTGTTVWTAVSDERLKDRIEPYTNGLAIVEALEPVRFHYKKDNALGADSDEEYIGFIAQDVEKVLPEAVTVGEEGYKFLNSDGILWAMFNAIKELKVELDAKDSKIAELEDRLSILEAKINQ